MAEHKWMRWDGDRWLLRLQPKCGAEDLWSPLLSDLHYHADGTRCVAYSYVGRINGPVTERYLRRKLARRLGRPGVRVIRWRGEVALG